MQYLSMSMKNMKKHGEIKRCKSSKPLSVLARNRLAMNSRLSQERKTPSVMIPFEDTAIFGWCCNPCPKKTQQLSCQFFETTSCNFRGWPKVAWLRLSFRSFFFFFKSLAAEMIHHPAGWHVLSPLQIGSQEPCILQYSEWSKPSTQPKVTSSSFGLFASWLCGRAFESAKSHDVCPQSKLGFEITRWWPTLSYTGPIKQSY